MTKRTFLSMLHEIREELINNIIVALKENKRKNAAHIVREEVEKIFNGKT